MNNSPSVDTHSARIQCNYFSCTTDSLMTCPIVLLHGWGVDSRVWESLTPLLQSQGDVIVVDILHYSDGAEEMVKQIVDAIGQRACYIGWSLGGMIATQIALSCPEHVAGLITLASNQQFVASQQWPYGLEQHIFDAFYHQLEKDIQDDTQYTLRQFMGLIAQGDSQCREQRRYLKAFQTTSTQPATSLLNGLRLLHCIQYRFNEVTVPRHHFFGECDLFVSQQAIDMIRDDNSQSLVTVLEGVGHLLHYPVERLFPLLVKRLSQWSEHE